MWDAGSPRGSSRSIRPTRMSTRRSSAASRIGWATSVPGCTPVGAATIWSSPTCGCGSLAAGRRIEGLITMLVRTLVARAREQAGTVMPGTTHARAAQPVTLGHHLLAHAWALLRDLERFDQAAVRTSVVAARGRRARHVDPRARSRACGGRPRVPTCVRQLDRRGVGPRLRPGVPGRRRDLRHPSLTPCGRSRSLDRSDARMGGARRGVHDRVQHHAAEAEPRYRGARAGEGSPDRRGVRRADVGAAGFAARLPPRPPGGQGAGVRRRGHARARAPGDGGSRRLDAVRRVRRCGQPPPTTVSTPPTSPRRSCAAACRSARRTGGPGRC